MIATTSTAVACATTALPSRRTSWKDGPEAQGVPAQFSSEKANINSASDNPFSDTYHMNTQPRTSLPNNASNIHDIEAQGHSTLQRFRKGRAPKCLAIFTIFLVWCLIVLGAFMLMETAFPGALRSVQEVKVALGKTKETVDMLKTQVGEMYRYVGSLKMGDVVGLSWGDATMVGAVEANGNGTMKV